MRPFVRSDWLIDMLLQESDYNIIRSNVTKFSALATCKGQATTDDVACGDVTALTPLEGSATTFEENCETPSSANSNKRGNGISN